MKGKKLTRRKFLRAAAPLAVLAPFAGTSSWAASPQAPRNLRIAGGGKTVLTPSDFKLLGVTRLPTTNAPAGKSGWASSLYYARGLAHRYVNGQLRLMIFGNFHWRDWPSDWPDSLKFPSPLLEFNLPASLGAAEDWVHAPAATLARYWENSVFRGKIHGDNGTTDVSDPPGNIHVIGLHWDAVDRRLYWTNSDGGFASGTASVFGYCTLDDSTGVATPVGSWKAGSSRYGGEGLTPVPHWFSKAYLQGQGLNSGRLAFGFGCGHASQANNGPQSYGPALVAVDPPDIGRYPDNTAVPHKTLLAYPFTDGTDHFCKRPGPYRNMSQFAVWPDPFPINAEVAEGEMGPWTLMDNSGGGVWIDTDPASRTSGKHGVIILVGLGHGDIMYVDSGNFCMAQDTYWCIVDPYDLEAIQTGSMQQHELVPKWHQFTWGHFNSGQGVANELMWFGSPPNPSHPGCTAYQVNYPLGPYAKRTFIGNRHSSGQGQPQYVREIATVGVGRLPGYGDGFSKSAYFWTTFDTTTGKLYVLAAHSAAWEPIVYVFQLNV